MSRYFDKDQAVKRMQKVLDDTGASEFIGAEKIAEWVDIDNGLGLGIDDSMKLLSGLIHMDVLEKDETIDEIVSALMELYNSINTLTPQPDLKKESMMIQISEFKIPPDDWTIHYSRAMGLMKKSKFQESSDEFDKVFEMLLEEPTTRGDLYRIFYNASIAHYLGGRPHLGEMCLSFSLNLNPNYPIARKKKESIEKGEDDDLIKLGVLKRAFTGLEEDRKRLDPKQYSGRPDKDLIRELEGYGVTFSREELVKASRESESRDDVINSLFIDTVADSPDADSVWAIAQVLWDRHCSGEPVAEAIIDSCAEIEEILEEDDRTSFKRIDKYLKDAEKVIYSGKKGVIERWSKYQEYFSSDRHTLMDVFMLYSSRKNDRGRFLKLSDHLYRTLDDPFWRITPIILEEGDIEGQIDWIRREYPEFYLLPAYMHLYYLEKKDLTRAHEAILEAVEIVERNRRSRKRYKWNSGSHLTDMDHVYSILEEFYDSFDIEGKREDILEKGRKVTERLKKKNEQEIDEKLNDIMMENVKKSPLYRYMEFIEGLGIDFKTEEDVETTIVNIDPLGRKIRKKKKKIGRNDPCPCGSGKKYKKCCLKI